ncbi:TetR/AcrR family transcriptional regulator [Mammaliicoccus sciuri]|uniref:TetR/AcrR family transcriptional regulator n=1 Tax=Mammaliicoccus sciuri TaxID=1296 RepID=UPI0037915D98
MKTFNKWDLRVQKTNKLLHTALLHLLNQYQFEDITVQMICNEAMVHRTTFYAHFQDKYHLLSSCLDYIVEEEMHFSKNNPSPTDSIMELLTIAKKYKNVLSQFIGNQHDVMQNVIQKNMAKEIKAQLQKFNITNNDLELDLMTEIHVASALAILKYFLEYDVSIDENSIRNSLKSLTQGL